MYGASHHPSYGPTTGSSALEYLVGPRGYDGGIHNGPFVNGRVKEPFQAPGPYNPFRFQRPWKRRINVFSVVQVLSVLLIVFAVTTYLYGFSVHYTAPMFCTLWVAFCIVFCAVFLIKGLMVYRKQRQEVLAVQWYLRDDDDTWFSFLVVAILTCVVLGYLVGNIIYSGYSLPYYTLSQLHNYTDVDPVSGGRGYLDAGAVMFAKGSFVDVSHGVGYKDGDVYCVAPVKLGNDTVANYDFWAVGTNCCNGFPGDFNCFEKDAANIADHPRQAEGALRVIDDFAIRHYKLAVMQASQEWGKPSPHPIFLKWATDPSLQIRQQWNDAAYTFAVCMVVFAAFELAIVFIMTTYFWRKRMWG